MKKSKKGEPKPKKSSYTKTFSYQKRMEQTKRDALEVLKKSFGNVSLTCEKVGVSRQTFYKWRNDDPEFNAEVEAINERTLDFVESKLMEGINNGNTRLIMFYLNCKGRKRGYGLKNETEGEKERVVLRITAEESDY